MAGAAPEVIFVVKKGTTARTLGPELQSEGLIDDPRLWRFHLWRRGGLALKAGRFKLSASMSIADLAKTLEGSPLPEDVPFVMIEGWRLRDTDERKRPRTAQSFCVPKADVAAQGYDLSLNRYKEVVHAAVEHRNPADILADLAKLEAEIQQGMTALRGMLK